MGLLGSEHVHLCLRPCTSEGQRDVLRVAVQELEACTPRTDSGTAVPSPPLLPTRVCWVRGSAQRIELMAASWGFPRQCYPDPHMPTMLASKHRPTLTFLQTLGPQSPHRTGSSNVSVNCAAKSMQNSVVQWPLVCPSRKGRALLSSL